MVSEEAERWIQRRVQVFAGWDHRKQHAPIAEGVVVAYAQHPTICVRADDGSQSDWQVTLPITVLEENAEIPAALWDRPQPVDTLRQTLAALVSAVDGLPDSRAAGDRAAGLRLADALANARKVLS